MTGRIRRPAALLLATLGFCACNRDRSNGQVVEETPPAPVATATVLREFPHDTAAFTQGLVYSNGAFYESTGRTGHSTLRQVEIATGKVLRQQAVPDRYFAEGLALYGGSLYQLTWQDQVGFIYAPADFRQTGTFTYEGEGWGLTTDGESLILSDGSSQLRFITPGSNTVRRSVNVMDGPAFINDLNELEWVKGEVWANVWHTDRIARIDPATGKVKGWVELAGLLDPSRRPDKEAVLNGIAYDAEHDRLFVTGKLWPALFEIAVPGVAGGGGAKAAETSVAPAP
ncbi:MAG TPA: glutaminyl-peptide cyclotransferase [Longimicrobium sp.]|nr:glutaminyl-peptide cyclotransferase [Longimicrobium sp.]